MRAIHTAALAGAAACLLTGAMAVARAQTLAPPEPEDAASAIVTAFKTHDLVLSATRTATRRPRIFCAPSFVHPASPTP